MTSHRISGMTVCLAASSISHFDDTWHVGACPIPMRYGAQFEAANCCRSTAGVGDCKWQKLNIILNQIMAISLGMPVRLRRHPPKNETLRLRPKPRACRERIPHDRYLEPAPIQRFWKNQTKPSTVLAPMWSQQINVTGWNKIVIMASPPSLLALWQLPWQEATWRSTSCDQNFGFSRSPTLWTGQWHPHQPKMDVSTSWCKSTNPLIWKEGCFSLLDLIIFYPRLLDLHFHPSFLGISCCQGASAAAAPLPPIEPTSNSWERQTTEPKKRPASMSTFYTCYFKMSNHFPKQRGILLHIELNPLRCNESFLLQRCKLMNSLAVRSYPSWISPSF